MATRNMSRLRMRLLAVSILPFTLAQSTSGSATLTTITGATSSASSTSNPMPSTSDNAPGNNTNNGKVDSNGLANYYFVFIALILCIGGLSGFFVARKRRRAMAANGGVRGTLATDATELQQSRYRRLYRQGRWRSAEVSREEGLNEDGEAPPPYMPKPQDEAVGQGASREGAPALPPQTLSREDAGLKPPDYSEQHVQAGDGLPRRLSTSGASSSQHAEQRSDL